MVAKTGLTVEEHVRRTVGSLLELRWLDPTLRIFPALQGDRVPEYLRCAELYARAGIDLTAEPLVGVGSVCQRQSTAEIVDLFAALHTELPGVRFHGFGLKILGLAAVAPAVRSADSEAWSRRGRSAGPCRHGLGHVSEANCPTFAIEWYRRVLAAAARTTPAAWQARARVRQEQPTLFDPPPPPAPALPTIGQAIARAARAFMPEGAEEPLSAALDAFRAQLGERSGDASKDGRRTPNSARRMPQSLGAGGATSTRTSRYDTGSIRPRSRPSRLAIGDEAPNPIALN